MGRIRDDRHPGRASVRPDYVVSHPAGQGTVVRITILDQPPAPFRQGHVCARVPIAQHGATLTGGQAAGGTGLQRRPGTDIDGSVPGRRKVRASLDFRHRGRDILLDMHPLRVLALVLKGTSNPSGSVGAVLDPVPVRVFAFAGMLIQHYMATQLVACDRSQAVGLSLPRGVVQQNPVVRGAASLEYLPIHRNGEEGISRTQQPAGTFGEGVLCDGGDRNIGWQEVGEVQAAVDPGVVLRDLLASAFAVLGRNVFLRHNAILLGALRPEGPEVHVQVEIAGGVGAGIARGADCAALGHGVAHLEAHYSGLQVRVGVLKAGAVGRIRAGADGDVVAEKLLAR